MAGRPTPPCSTTTNASTSTHILAHQHPETGMFAYFMPLAAGARRTWSTPDNSFWCCVGSGMERPFQAWRFDLLAGRGDALRQPVHPRRRSTGAASSLELDTDFPFDETVTLTVAEASDAPVDIALRLPGWCAAPEVRLRTMPRSRSSGATIMPCSAGAGAAATGSNCTCRWCCGSSRRPTIPMSSPI